MKLGYVMASGRGETNRLLAALAGALAERGLRLAGTVQTDTPRPKDHHCDMDVRVLPDGPVLRISQDLGAGSHGCRLDPQALEQAVQLSARALSQGADFVVINKFGKHEAEGRGFRAVIAEALGMGLPVIVGTNKLNLAAFLAFAGEDAQALPEEPDALLAWAETARMAREGAA